MHKNHLMSVNNLKILYTFAYDKQSYKEIKNHFDKLFSVHASHPWRGTIIINKTN